MSTLVAVLLALILGQTPLKTFEGKVVAIADGDTLTVLRADKTQAKVRLHGIDAPESGQDFGTVARRHLGELCHEKTVWVEPVELDRYGRIVARVSVGSESINVRQVRDGMAWWFRKYAPGDVTFEQAESEARKAKRGLWSAPAPVAPWEWRAGTTLPIEVAGKFVASSKSKVYHSPGCRSIPRILERNRLVYDSAELARKAGYVPAKDCQ